MIDTKIIGIIAKILNQKVEDVQNQGHNQINIGEKIDIIITIMKEILITLPVEMVERIEIIEGILDRVQRIEKMMNS